MRDKKLKEILRINYLLSMYKINKKPFTEQLVWKRMLDSKIKEILT